MNGAGMNGAGMNGDTARKGGYFYVLMTHTTKPVRREFADGFDLAQGKLQAEQGAMRWHKSKLIFAKIWQ
jgi:hypothetical protein